MTIIYKWKGIETYVLQAVIVWSFVIYERPILGESLKPHFVANFQISLEIHWMSCRSHMKSDGFHEIRWISCLKNFKSDNSREKLHFYRMQWAGYVIWNLWNLLDFIWNPPDFMKSAGFRDERPLARNDKAYVLSPDGFGGFLSGKSWVRHCLCMLSKRVM